MKSRATKLVQEVSNRARGCSATKDAGSTYLVIASPGSSTRDYGLQSVSKDALTDVASSRRPRCSFREMIVGATSSKCKDAQAGEGERS